MTPTNNRHVLNIDLQPVAGEIFQPTGFPDIGHAVFSRRSIDDSEQPKQIECLLVESAQSMANRLEAVLWNDNACEPIGLLKPLPWVEVRGDGSDTFLTSSRLEAHRLASAFIKDSKLEKEDMSEVMKKKMQLEEDRPHSNHEIAKAIFQLDPLCLIHGIWFSKGDFPGYPKISRALTACIEAENITRVHSGGVKRDHVRHEIKDKATDKGSEDLYGFIPFHRTEYTARKITARFVIDLNQIRSYGLSEEATNLLEKVALYQVTTLLEGSLRLRTACDLEPVDKIATREGKEFKASDLEKEIDSAIPKVPELKDANVKNPLIVKWPEKSGAKKKNNNEG